MLGTREYIVISGKRDFAYGIQLRIQKRDDHPRFSDLLVTGVIKNRTILNYDQKQTRNMQ